MKSTHSWLSGFVTALLVAVSVTTSAAQIQNEEPRGTIISPQKAKSLTPYAFASQLAHTYKLNGKSEKSIATRNKMLGYEMTPVDSKDLPEPIKYLFIQDETQRFWSYSGLQARAFYHHNKKNIVLAFAGTDFHPLMYRSYATAGTANLIAYGYSTPMLTQASALCRAFKEIPEVENIIVTGNSLGGAVAHYAGLACGAKTIAFNSLALPENLRQQAILDYINYHSIEDSFSIDPSYRSELSNAGTPKQLELIEVEGEALNNTKGMWIIQGQHPKNTPIQIVPSHDKKLGSVGRHWAPAVIKSLETHSR
ncbi:hypothetical protein M3P05_05910 [Sansalvadorimonas sp. 2012CJ34-2]|uniref:Uncharacterized protein n=1 Tax=Parendozoicomonas callyspongiae TaxID=2942213 RepID=A0ABT0PDM8_9GAMM|nr:hypothetical protein [Sansalvadorimonas sp. 2012CJ34-2]MCL6269474.1 hypothetical protein [Sansalvadorimonas sp. 2012CJ34-2]